MDHVRRAVRVRAAATVSDELCCALGRAVRAHRERAGMSQVTLAELAACRQTDVSEWENGVQAMSVRALVLVAAATGVPPGRLLDEAYGTMTPCALLALPRARARRPVPQGPEAPPIVIRAPEGPEPAPMRAGALDALARLLVRAGVPPDRADWAASRLEEAAAAGVCQVGFTSGPGCPERPARLAVRVDRGGRVVARVVCEAHARQLDCRWALVGPEKT